MGSRPAVRSAILAALAAALGAPAEANFPPEPHPLWKLVGASERIVLARVESIAMPQSMPEPRLGPDGPADASARLRVLETWKGEHAEAVTVLFSPGLVGVRPEHFATGATVLAFLVAGETRLRGIADPARRAQAAERYRGRWLTVALSYGTLYPAPDEVPRFRARVAEAVALQEAERKHMAERRAWLVRTVAEPATRWHGAYELRQMLDPQAAPGVLMGAPLPSDSLTAEEWAEMAAAFARDPLADETTPLMLGILAGHASAEVDRAALAAMEAALAEGEVPYWAHQAMPLVLARFEKEELPPISPHGEGLRPTDEELRAA